MIYKSYTNRQPVHRTIMSMVAMKRKVTKRVVVEKMRMKVMRKEVGKMVVKKLLEIQVKLQDIVEKGDNKYSSGS